MIAVYSGRLGYTGGVDSCKREWEIGGEVGAWAGVDGSSRHKLIRSASAIQVAWRRPVFGSRAATPTLPITNSSCKGCTASISD
ncbi:hypothetical protein IG631_08148 [Alternaria alternata]|nr:hypothetical protein IG631_08148 [Alternaria alternata]